MLFPLCAYLVQYCVESRAPKVASSVQACQITGTEPRHPKRTLLPLLPLNIKESFVDLIAQTRTNKGVVLVRLQHRGVITQVAEPCVLRYVQQQFQVVAKVAQAADIESVKATPRHTIRCMVSLQRMQVWARRH